MVMVLLTLTGCLLLAEAPPDLEPAVHPSDADGDGFSLDDGDCDDGDAESFPGAPEDGSDNVDQDCDGVPQKDLDGDGYVSASTGGEDCDDYASAVNPGAEESCDRLDNDCDGSIDEDAAEATTWYEDNDHDGYGDATTGFLSCEGEDTTVANDDDCNDADSAIRPGVMETCDGVDEDCDGSLPEEEADADADGWMVCEGDCDDADASVGDRWYADLDGDGFGDAAVTSSCTHPDDYVAVGEDCDDTSASVYPGATEGCDGIDQDCDGELDEGFDADLDGYLSSADCASGDDCDDSDAVVNPAATEVCEDGLDNDCDGGDACGIMGTLDLSAADAKIVGEETEDYAGAHLAVGDVDGDGVDDALLGVPYQDAGGESAGAVYLVRGPVSDTFDLGSADARLDGEEGGASAGYGVASGDWDGDGLSDIAVGAPSQDDRSADAGEVYLVLGPVTGAMDLGEADVKVLGQFEDRIGQAIVHGDLDGDGDWELVLGGSAWNDDNAGVVYVVEGPISGTVNLLTSGTRLLGEDSDDYAGNAIAATDLDGDGLDDMCIAASRANAEIGVVYLMLGPASSAADLSDYDGILTGEARGDYAGTALAVGELDGDGAPDLVVGASGDDTGASGAGAAYAVLGPSSGAKSLADADVKFYGSDTGDSLGSAIAAGDFHAAGFDQVLLGAYGADAGGGWSGETYLFAFPASGTISVSEAEATLNGEDLFDQSGISIATGDLSGDGVLDALVGANKDDDGATDAGAAYVIFGRGL